MRPMSDDHKAALSKGRAEGKAVREYVEGLRSLKPKRGRKRTVESITARLGAIDVELVDAQVMRELQLVQERRDLLAEIDTLRHTIDIGILESAFVDVAESYSKSKGIAYASWRDVGVDGEVLKRAGISRAS